MPTTTAERAAPDMSHVWAGRDRATDQRQTEKAIAVLLAKGWTQVILIGPDGRTATYTHP